MSSISAIPQNKLGGIISSALRAGKDALNYPGKLPESVPLLGGMGAGDLVFGQGPELAEDMSYGFGPTKGAGWATKVDPRVVDLAFAPGVGTAAGMALRGGAAIPKAAVQMATNEGRREFMKKAAGLAAGGVVTAATPDMLIQALKKAPAALADAAPLVAKEVAPAAVAQAARAWTPEMIRAAIPKISEHIVGEPIKSSPSLSKSFVQQFPTPEVYQRHLEALEFNPDPFYANISESARSAREQNIEHMLGNYYPDEFEEIVSSGKVPKELADKGVTYDQVLEAKQHSSTDPYIFDEGDDSFPARLFDTYYKEPKPKTSWQILREEYK